MLNASIMFVSMETLILQGMTSSVKTFLAYLRISNKQCFSANRSFIDCILWKSVKLCKETSRYGERQ